MAATQLATNSPPGYKSDKEWRDAIRRVVHSEVTDETGKRTKRIVRLAESLVTAAEAGDVSALKELGNRLDGVPAQSVSVTGADGGALLVADVSDREVARQVALLLTKVGGAVIDGIAELVPDATTASDTPAVGASAQDQQPGSE